MYDAIQKVYRYSSSYCPHFSNIDRSDAKFEPVYVNTTPSTPLRAMRSSRISAALDSSCYAPEELLAIAASDVQPPAVSATLMKGFRMLDLPPIFGVHCLFTTEPFILFLNFDSIAMHIRVRSRIQSSTKFRLRSWSATYCALRKRSVKVFKQFLYSLVWEDRAICRTCVCQNSAQSRLDIRDLCTPKTAANSKSILKSRLSRPCCP